MSLALVACGGGGSDTPEVDSNPGRVIDGKVRALQLDFLPGAFLVNAGGVVPEVTGHSILCGLNDTVKCTETARISEYLVESPIVFSAMGLTKDGVDVPATFMREGNFHRLVLDTPLSLSQPTRLVVWAKVSDTTPAGTEARVRTSLVAENLTVTIPQYERALRVLIGAVDVTSTEGRFDVSTFGQYAAFTATCPETSNGCYLRKLSVALTVESIENRVDFPYSYFTIMLNGEEVSLVSIAVDAISTTQREDLQFRYVPIAAGESFTVRVEGVPARGGLAFTAAELITRATDQSIALRPIGNDCSRSFQVNC